MVPDNPLTCAEKLAAAHESATLLQASWKLADIVDGALEGAGASTLEDASRHPVAEAAAARRRPWYAPSARRSAASSPVEAGEAGRCSCEPPPPLGAAAETEP